MRTLRFFSTSTIALILVCGWFTKVAVAQHTEWDGQEQPRTHTTDISHIEMHISFDEPAKKVIGTVIHTLSVLPQQDADSHITFDAADLTIQRVWLQTNNGKHEPLSFDTSTQGKLIINLPKPATFGASMKIGIDYFGFPKRGMYFIEPDTFYTKRPEQIWTQGEGEDNHHWLPTYDSPNDKTTTDMYVTVRANQEALSNGRLVNKKKNRDGSVTWHWEEDKPYSTYLIMLGIGDYAVVTDKWHGKNVEYWVYPQWEKDAHRIFGLTPDMIDFFSTKTGFPYAWDKYAQIAIADFMYGGMENVSATTLNDYVLFDKRSGVDFSSEGLIAHELAHQWFGDVVTCRGWIHMWLNESFATYFEAMYRQHHDGQDEFEQEMSSDQQAGINVEASRGKRAIVHIDGYTENTYPRGAATLNMIRHIVGEQGWWASIHHYLELHAFQPVVTEDFKMAIEEATGKNLNWFFDEWLYKSGHPVYDVSYTYDNNAKAVRLKVVQSQERDSLTSTFKMPIDVELWMPDGSRKTQTIFDGDSAQTFEIAADQPPSNIIFDKGSTIIKELHFTKDASSWLDQLRNGTAIERTFAAQQLTPSNFEPSEAIRNALMATAMNDSFWATRRAALESLAQQPDSLHRTEPVIVQVLTRDKNHDVRAAAVPLVAGHVHAGTAVDLLAHVVETDSAYSVVGAALAELAKLDSEKAVALALPFLQIESPRDRIRNAAIHVISDFNTESALNELIELVAQHDRPEWTRWNIIKDIAAKTNVDSARVFSVLWSLTKNGDPTIRNTAYDELAKVGTRSTYDQMREEAASHPEWKDRFDIWLKRMETRLKIQ